MIINMLVNCNFRSTSTETSTQTKFSKTILILAVIAILELFGAQSFLTKVILFLKSMTDPPYNDSEIEFRERLQIDGR